MTALNVTSETMPVAARQPRRWSGEIRHVIGSTLQWALPPLIGAVMLAAAVPKLRGPFHFLLDLYAYDIVGVTTGRVVAALLPWLELMIGVCLIGGFCAAGALLLADGLMALFITAQLWAIAHHATATCACFNLTSQISISYASIARDVLFLLTISLALGLNWPRRREQKFAGRDSRE